MEDLKGLSHISDEFDIEMPDGTTKKGYVGLGDPRNPYNGQLLSEDEEKRIDAEGKHVIQGAPWSETSTDLYLSVLAAPGPVTLDRKIFGGTSVGVNTALTKGADLRVFLGTTLGRPVVGVTCYGAALELPVDLGSDPLKRRYVTEWIAHTAVEALSNYGIGFDLGHKELGLVYQELAIKLSAAAEDSILRSGL